MLVIQRRNLLESVRPEIVIDGWSRVEKGDGEHWHELLEFTSIRNVGRGPALNVILRSDVADPPFAVADSKSIAVIATNQKADVRGSILLFWSNAQEIHSGVKFLPIHLEILFWDTRNQRHQCVYRLMVMGGSPGYARLDSGHEPWGMPDETVPGVQITDRRTSSSSVVWLRFRSRLRSAPRWAKRRLQAASMSLRAVLARRPS